MKSQNLLRFEEFKLTLCEKLFYLILLYPNHYVGKIKNHRLVLWKHLQA